MHKLLLILTLALAASAQASDYYVAPNGSDSAAGSKAAPWRSIARAQQAAQAGDTVYLRGGRYVYSAGENVCPSRTGIVNGVTLDKSGSEGKPIRYWAYPGETPVFDFSGSTAAITCLSSSTCTTIWGRDCSSRTAPTTWC